MARLILVERTFGDRQAADRCLDSLRATVWPCVWCTEHADHRHWTVKALVEQLVLAPVVGDSELRTR